MVHGEHDLDARTKAQGETGLEKQPGDTGLEQCNMTGETGREQCIKTGETGLDRIM